MKKELKEITLEHMLYVIAQVTLVEVTSAKFTGKDEIVYTYVSKRGKGYLEESIYIKSCSYVTIDYLRQFYNIPNPYAPIVGVGKSAEEVLAEHGIVKDSFGGELISDDMADTYYNQVISAMQSYASQPIGKGAEEAMKYLQGEYDALKAIRSGIPEDSPKWHDYSGRMEQAERMITAVQMGYLPPLNTTPTTNWEKVDWRYVRSVISNFISLDLNNEVRTQQIVEWLQSYLKQHIGGGDSNTSYNDRIDSMVPNGWQQKLFDYIVNELNAMPLNDQLTDIRDIILPKRYPYTLTAPASEQVDWQKFVEWMWESRWYNRRDGKWCYTFEGGTAMSKNNYEKNYMKTTEELYQVFIKNTRKNQ